MGSFMSFPPRYKVCTEGPFLARFCIQWRERRRVMETKQQAACYIRVSTEGQTEYSPEAQRRALEGYARQHGYSINPAHVYVDAGISGRRAETRPAFMAMIA